MVIERKEEEQQQDTPTKKRDPFVFSPNELIVVEPLMKYLRPEATENVKEVVINQPKSVGIEYFDGSWEFKEDPELSADALTAIMRLLAMKTGQTFDNNNPILSCRMPGGHRGQIVAGQQNDHKFSMSVRIHQTREITLEDFEFDPKELNMVKNAVNKQKTIWFPAVPVRVKPAF